MFAMGGASGEIAIFNMQKIVAVRTTGPSSSSSSPSHLLFTGFLGMGAEEAAFGTSSSDASALLAMVSGHIYAVSLKYRTPVRHFQTNKEEEGMGRLVQESRMYCGC